MLQSRTIDTTTRSLSIHSSTILRTLLLEVIIAWSLLSTEAASQQNQLLESHVLFEEPKQQQYLQLQQQRQLQSPEIDYYDTSSGGAFAAFVQESTIALNHNHAADSSTGVAHFRHVNRPDLVTFVFSNGRHEPTGINSFVTIDFGDSASSSSSSSSNPLDPFHGATETLLDPESGGGSYTWVSTYTQSSNSNSNTNKHYVLFSGGNTRDGVVYPSKLYSFPEKGDGSLQDPRWEWSATPTHPARFGKLVDLGNIRVDPTDPDSPSLSAAGQFDIVISGVDGLVIYSLQQNDDDGSIHNTWRQIRNLPVEGSTGKSYMGVDLWQANKSDTDDNKAGSLLVVVNRSDWWMTERLLDAPCIVYDYRTDQIVHRFAAQGQTVSVAVIDDQRHIIVGAGGQDITAGQPNVMYQRSEQSAVPALDIGDRQLIPTAPTLFGPMERDDDYGPISADRYEEVGRSGLTKTRQVLPFRLDGYASDYILEINMAQPAYIYCRDVMGETFRIIPIPGSEGRSNDQNNVYARAADILIEPNTIFVVLAMNFGENIVYALDRSLLLDPRAEPSTSPPALPPTSSPLPQQKEAPLEAKCGSVASDRGFGGAAGQSKGCDGRLLKIGTKRRLKGRRRSNLHLYYEQEI